MARKLQPWALMVILLFITSQPATCEDSETFHIISRSHCPGELTGEPCFTLSQYLRGDYRQYTSDPSEMVLEFQPGFHTTGKTKSRTLASQLSSFIMNSENPTHIYCFDNIQYQITNVQSVLLSSINFVYCKVQIESVMNFTLEESSLSQIYGLQIQSSSATIIGCNFTNNRILPALHIDNSSLELHHTNFINNNGIPHRILGVLSIANTTSMVTISHCTFTSNSAFYNGGVASIRNATVSILNSTFTQNRARRGNGGVFAVDDSEITIHDSMFDNNTAGTNGGVISINYLRSALFISHTSFTNNKASNQGGVMYLRRKGSEVKISRSTIGFNNATRGGFATVHGSSLEITTSNIFNNTAETGEVISACSSDISVSDQLTIATDPVYSVCTLISGNIDDTDLEPTTAASTDTQVDTTTITYISTTTNYRAMATSETTVTTSQPTEPNITASVYFELNGKVYLNYSIISLLEVGENENALLCKTDLVTCCVTQSNRFGRFHYPSGETVLVKKAERGFYRNRGAQVIRLNRREGVTSPAGRFHCAIPDASGITQNLYIYLL